MSAGRPLRFLGTAVGGWIVLRTLALWPDVAALERHPTVAVPRARVARGAASVAYLPAKPVDFAGAVSRRFARAQLSRRHQTHAAGAAWPTLRAMASAPMPVIGTVQPRQVTTIPPPYVLPPLAPPGSARASRWRGSAWMIARGGTAQTLLGGQLGASQAGARLTYTLDTDRRIALSGRVSAPLCGRGSEAAIGVDWQPSRLPVHVIAEQRIGLDGNRGGPTVELVGGIGPVGIAQGVQLDGYAQAGAIARGGIEAFADGAARLTHPVVQRDRVRLDLGLGAWGGAQRGAARLDVGPTLGIVVPVGRIGLRLTADCGIMYQTHQDDYTRACA
jgi:hypothetical protein